MKNVEGQLKAGTAHSTRLRPHGATRVLIIGWSLALVAALLIAAYVGFRLPNLWATTLYNVTLADGTARRALFGTLMAPVWLLFNHSYAGYALISLLITALLACILFCAGLGARTSAQRVLIILWLLAPTGGYLFHEIGYLDQVNYLLLFLAIFLWTRCSPLLAVLPIIAAVFVHESALLTCLPVLIALAGLSGFNRMNAVALSLPVIVGGALMLVPPMGEATARSLATRLEATLPFGFRADALELFTRTQSESWRLYSITDGLRFVLPLAVCLLIFWYLALLMTRNRTRHITAGLGILFLASISPLLLVFGGWDFSRWIFLSLTNFSIVLFLWIQASAGEPSITLMAVAVLPFLSLAYHPLVYFDDRSPRSLDAAQIVLELKDPGFLLLPEK